jgi:hypothetical protein
LSYYANILRRIADNKMIYGMNTPESLDLRNAAAHIERLEDLLLHTDGCGEEAGWRERRDRYLGIPAEGKSGE